VGSTLDAISQGRDNAAEPPLLDYLLPYVLNGRAHFVEQKFRKARSSGRFVCLVAHCRPRRIRCPEKNSKRELDSITSRSQYKSSLNPAPCCIEAIAQG
jgi:hypothetical protein